MVPVDFTAIDFETANASSASACAVGLVRVRSGRLVEEAGWLIHPPAGHDAFFEVNVGIHGIRSDDVADAPGWSAQLSDLVDFIGADVLAAHNAAFDMAVIRRACHACGDACPPFPYVCSLQLARKTYALPSYRLPAAAAAAGFTGFTHHDPLADARACAHIVTDAARRAGVDDVAALAAAHGLPVQRIGTLADHPEPRFHAA